MPNPKRKNNTGGKRLPAAPAGKAAAPPPPKIKVVGPLDDVPAVDTDGNAKFPSVFALGNAPNDYSVILTENVINKIEEFIVAGLTIKEVAGRMGIAADVLDLWVEKGQQMQRIIAAVDLFQSGEHTKNDAVAAILREEVQGRKIPMDKIEEILQTPPDKDARYYLALAVLRGVARAKEIANIGMSKAAKTTSDFLAIRDRMK